MIKKRNHFASLERREKEKAEKDKLARSKDEKTESELNQWWKYRKSTRVLTNKQQFLKEAKEELTRLRLRRFKEKERLKAEKDRELMERFEAKKNERE